MEQMIKDSQIACEKYMKAMDAFNEMMKRSKCPSDYYIEVYSNYDVKKGWERLCVLSKVVSLHLAGTKGEFVKEAHIAFQEAAHEATEIALRTTKIINDIHSLVKEEKETEASTAKGWTIFWIIVACAFVGMGVAIALRTL